VLAVSIGGWSPKLMAADCGAQLGIVAGLSVPDAENPRSYYLYGIKGQAFIDSQLSLGGYHFLSDRSGEVDLAHKFRYALTGIEGAYHFSSQKGDTFIGLRLGLTKVLRTQSAYDFTFSPYHYGFVVGYDYYLSKVFSVGFEASYLHVFPSRTNRDGVDYNAAPFNLVNFLVTGQIRF
jgi:hypothetical protein